jgi:hypothetical protein
MSTCAAVSFGMILGSSGCLMRGRSVERRFAARRMVSTMMTPDAAARGEHIPAASHVIDAMEPRSVTQYRA